MMKTDDINDQAITKDKIHDGNITSEKLADGAVSTDKLPDGAIKTPKIADENITTSKLAEASVVTSKIADQNVTKEKIADQSVDNSKLSPSAVTYDKVKNKAITTEKLNDRAVTTEKVEEKAITNAKIGDSAVDGRTIGEASVEKKHLANDSVATEKLKDSSVTSDKIHANAVTGEKIEDSAISNPKLADNSVGTSKIKDGNVTNEKVASNTLTIDKFDPELRKSIQAATGLPENLVEVIQDVDVEVKSLHSKDEDLQAQITDKQQQITANDKDIETLQNRSTQMEQSINNIAVTGGASVANTVAYSNTASGLVSINAQGAIDELAAKNSTKAEKAEVTAELEKKFDKESILQESGDAEDKVMSQKAVSDKLSDLRNNVNEFNVSKIYPKDGLDKEGAEGGNMYSLKSAISKVKSYIKTGERLSFINLSGKPEIWEYYYTSGNTEDLNNWINIGGDEISRINKCVNTNTISINGNKQVINITNRFSLYSLFVPKGRKVKVSITNFEAEDSISIACSVTFLDGSNKQIANFGNYGSTVYIAEKEVKRIEFYDNKNNLISAEITITVNEEGIEGRVLTLENSISSSSAKVNILEEAVKSKLNKKTKLSDYCNILLGKDIENGKIVENESKKIVQLPYKLIPDEGLLSMNNDRTITQKSASNQMLITDENLNIIQVIHSVDYYLITIKSKSIIDNNLDKKLYLNVVYNINDEIPLRPFIDNSYIINGLGDNIADDYYIRSTNLINFDNRAMANIDPGNGIFQSNTSGLYIWGVKLDSKENLYCNTKATAGGTAKLYKLDPSKGYIFYSNVAIITPDTTLGKHVNVMTINIEDVDIDDITNMYLIFRHQGAATFPCIVSKNPFMPDSDYYIVNPKYIGLPNKLNALILGDSYSSLGHWITYLTKYIRITGLVNVAVVGASIRDFGQENPNMNLCGQADTIESYVTKGIIYTDENEYPDIIILQGGENEGPDSDEVFSKYNTQFSKVVNAYVKKNDTAVLQNVSVPTPLSEVNKKTFAGAYRYIAEKLLTLFPRAQLFITSVTRLGYINTSNLGEYREKEAIQQRTIAARMSVPFIDFAGLSGINDIFNYPRGSGTKDDPYTNGPARDTFDSMHPNYNDNASGASKLGQVAANCIKSNIIKLSK